MASHHSYGHLLAPRYIMHSGVQRNCRPGDLAAATVVIISLPAQASDPATGTWELNLAKSKFTNSPAPKSQTRTYEVTGQQVKMTGKGIDAQGKPTLFGFTAKTDGKDYPYTGSGFQDTISLTPVDALT
ncbi:MAG TPA: hypothetical protein VFF53_12725, partial [Geobacteraceae bacterium]|nr:hypothetical protein [Geobacteraceae bacterium]